MTQVKMRFLVILLCDPFQLLFGDLDQTFILTFYYMYSLSTISNKNSYILDTGLILFTINLLKK